MAEIKATGKELAHAREMVSQALEEAQQTQKAHWDAMSNLETQIAFLYDLDADQVEIDGYGDLEGYTVDSIIEEATFYDDEEPEANEG